MSESERHSKFHAQNGVNKAKFHANVALAFSQKCGTGDFRFFFFCFDLTVPAAM